MTSSQPSPAWLVAAVSFAEFIGLKPGRPVRLSLTIMVWLGCVFWFLYCIYLGLRAAAHERLPIDTAACAVRAELAFIVWAVAYLFDLVGLIGIVRSSVTPNMWTAFSGKALGCARATAVARRSIGAQPALHHMSCMRRCQSPPHVRLVLRAWVVL